MTDAEMISLAWQYADDIEIDVFNGPTQLTMLLREAASRIQKDRWVPAEEKMPDEHDSIFKKFKGTGKWSSAMFEMTSDRVLVTVEFEDGSRATETAHTNDGQWRFDLRAVPKKVIAWKPFPAPLKGEVG